MSKSKKQIRRSPRLRYAKRIAIGLFAFLALAALTFPIWSIWLAKPLVAKFAGAEIGELESEGWDRWHAQSIRWSNESAKLSIDEASLPSPTQLALQLLSLSSARQEVVVKNWTLEITPPSEPAENPGPPPTIESILNLTRNSLAKANAYITGASLSDGSITLNDSPLIAIDSATLDPDRFAVTLTHEPTAQTARLSLDSLQSETWTLKADSRSFPIAADLSLKQSSDEIAIEGTLASAENSIAINAHWPASATFSLPEEATVRTDSFQLDQRYDFWQGSPPLSIDASIEAKGENFAFSIQGSATDENDQNSTVQFSGNGDFSRIEVNELQAALPWLSIDSNKPIVFDFTQDNPIASAELVAELDLANLPVVEAKGKATASLRTEESDSGNSRFLARLQGENISFFDTTLSSLNSEIEYEGNLLEITKLEIESTNNSVLSAAASLDLKEKRISASQLSLNLNNESDRLAALTPKLGWKRITADLSAAGPLVDPNLSGELSATQLKVSGINPFDLSATLNGRQQDIDSKLKLTIPDESLEIDLSLARSAEAVTATVNELTLSRERSQEAIKSQNPFTTRIPLSDTRIEANSITLLDQQDAPVLSLTSFSFSPSEISATLTASNLSPRIIQNWVEAPLPPLVVESLDTDLTLSKEGLSARTTGLANWYISENNAVDLSWSIHSEIASNDSIYIDDLKIGSNAKHILAVSGSLPVSASWTQSSLGYRLNENAPLALSLQSSPHPDFWRSIEKYFPIAITRPVAKAELHGTLNEPEGFLDLKLDRLSWTQSGENAKSLDISDINASLKANTQSVTIESLTARNGGNTLSAQAKIPLNQYQLSTVLRGETKLDLSNFEGNATLKLVDLPAIQGWLPEALRADGQAEVNLSMKPQNLSATVSVRNLATRPLPPLGSLSEISGELIFNDGKWTTEGITGLAEGNPFTFSGNADLANLNKPTYDLRFKSEEFPIVRDSGLLLSGNIDLKLVSTSSSQTALSGQVKLTKGLFLVEPNLIASSTKTVQTTPPYFSVEQTPFNSWNLNISIEGDDFMRVSNSFFEGTLSADFNLEGTLGAPLLTGRAAASSGQIFFPASSLRLTHGEAFITRQQPSVLQIDAAARGRLFRWDVNLTATGPAEDPNVVINTNPALTQVEALLLLTTGTNPDASNDLAQNSATSLGVFIGKGLFRKLSGNSGDSASRLTLEIGNDVSYQGRRTVEAGYEISDTLQAEGEYNKRDEFNANLIWTFFEK